MSNYNYKIANGILSLVLFCLLNVCSLQGQNDTIAINNIVNSVCSYLDSVDNVQDLSKIEITNTIEENITKYKTEWTKKADKSSSSKEIDATEQYKTLLNHRLLLDCAKYRLIEYRLDKNSANNELYQNAKNFLIALETNISNDSLVKYFKPETDKDSLLNAIKILKRELPKYNRLSDFYIMKPSHFSAFYIFISDFKSGDYNIMIGLTYDDESSQLFNVLACKTKEQIEIEKKETERKRSSSPPPPPPPPE